VNCFVTIVTAVLQTSKRVPLLLQVYVARTATQVRMPQWSAVSSVNSALCYRTFYTDFHDTWI